MTTVLNTIGIVPYGKLYYDAPEIEKDLESIARDMEHDLRSISFDNEDDYKYYLSNLEGHQSSVATYADDNNIEDYHNYVEELEETIRDMSRALINLSIRSQQFSKDILSLENDSNRQDISEMFLDLSAKAEEVMDCGSPLSRALSVRGWTESQREYLFSILGVCAGSKYLEMIAEISSPKNIVIGIKDKIEIINNTVTLKAGNEQLKIFPENHTVCVVYEIQNQGKPVYFHLKDMEGFFFDLKNPTEDEVLVYEMAHSKLYDISRWKDIFNL